ncbi:MAG: hypothetical protein IRZ16_10080, partial [Myxococcaceae bacterium]|nr:hypothetical protein [Myxococcaceae bacterium]
MPALSATRTPVQLLGRASRQLPAIAVLFTLIHLARGGFRGLAQLGWWE